MITAGGQVRWQELPELIVGPDSMIGGYLRAHHALLAPGGTPDDRDAWRDTLEQICQWAWTAAMGPLRSALARIHSARRARVVLVPVDALCVVPWHAAYPAEDQGLPPSERRYALDAVTFSYAASGALMSRIARRSPPVLGSSVLLVGDPGGDLPNAQAETQALRIAFYPGAIIWGEPPELTDAAATPARLHAALADAGHSLFHYAGHATVDAAKPGSSALVLGDQRLRAERISGLTPRESYCVCLAACTTHLATDAFDEVFTLSTAFLLGGASTVLGSLWRMKDAGTAVLMFLVHHYLSRGARPVDALHRAQIWMLNPDRRIPESMPASMRNTLPGLDLADPVIWAGLTHQGH
jgi:CHAT domain-containing protein